MSSQDTSPSAETRAIAGYEFWRAGVLQIRRTAEGLLDEYVHELPHGTRANRHAQGPFCRFGLPAAPRASGVYAIFVGTDLRYVGQCQDLAERFGPRGYGDIHARNCHSDGQSTNCKVNARVLEAAKNGHTATVWFHPTAALDALEAKLIKGLTPSWNGRQSRSARATADSPQLRRLARRRHRSSAQPPRKSEFETALRRILMDAQGQEEPLIQIRAGDLHTQVGNYPGPDHRMPSCCSAMRSLMEGGDRFVYEPPRGDGARLTIEYRLPRSRHAARITF